MRKLASHLLALGPVTCLVLLGAGTAFAQPSLPPDEDGGSYTNSPYTNYFSNVPLPPGLKFGAPVVESTNLRLILLEADPEGSYDLYFATNTFGPVWSNVLNGTAGQTNFLVSKPEPDGGFFRAARADIPVTNATAITAVFPYEFVSTNRIMAFITGGPAASMAIATNAAAVSNALWIPFNATPTIDVGEGEGVHEVWFGFKGADGVAYWSVESITVDTTPPSIVVTNPTLTTTSRPFLQVQGFSPESLSEVSFDVINAAGATTNEPGFVTSQAFDTNQFKFTTNWFQCFDVGLTNGSNSITVRVADLAGNVSSTNFVVTLDFSGDTNPPATTVIWPPTGAQIGGDSFTLRGTVDDETATVWAEIVDSSGTTNLIDGLVERNGKLWIEDVPLGEGTNNIALTLVDAAGNTNTTSLVVNRSSPTLTITALDESQLNLSTTTIGGTISDSSYDVWVNGIEAEVDEGGNWTAANVPVYGNGTAVFDAIAYPPTGTNATTPVQQSLAQEKPSVIFVYHHENDWTQQFPDYGQFFHLHKTYDEDFDTNGHRFFSGRYNSNGQDGDDGYAWWNWRFEWSDTNTTGIEIYERGLTGEDYYDPQYYESGTRPGPPGNEFITSIPATSLVDDYIHGNSPIRHYYANVHATNYAQVSQTAMKLKTGGKSGIKRNNLFTITASALAYGRNANVNWDGERDYWVSTPASAIDPTRIRVMGKWVGNDGKLFIVLPDNAMLDLKASAPARHYDLSVTQTKHKLRILANDVLLAPDRIRTNAEFCVGQKINFQSLFTPSLGAEVQQTWPEWLFGSTFVNYIENWPEDAKKYLIDWQLTFQTNTHAWWLDGGKKSVVCIWDVAFTNGQEVHVKSRGKLKIDRPEMVEFTNTPPFFPWITTNKTTLGRPWLMLGEEDGGFDGSMKFFVKVVSKFPGTNRWTQLINQYRYRDDVPAGSWTISTDGQFEADGGEFYVPEGLSIPLSPGSTNSLAFGDGPGNPVGFSITESHDVFKTYLRFRPTGDDSIWVTLGRVDWSWQTTASCPSGSPYSWQNWIITSNNIPTPVYSDDTTIPFWNDTVTSIGE